MAPYLRSNLSFVTSFACMLQSQRQVASPAGVSWVLCGCVCAKCVLIDCQTKSSKIRVLVDGPCCFKNAQHYRHCTCHDVPLPVFACCSSGSDALCWLKILCRFWLLCRCDVCERGWTAFRFETVTIRPAGIKNQTTMTGAPRLTHTQHKCSHPSAWSANVVGAWVTWS